MNNITEHKLLRRAASQASQVPFFLAGDLEAFRIRRNMGDGDLAYFLNCKSEDLPRLGLCRRLDPDSGTFRSDVDRVADAFRVQAERLAQIIREREVLDAIGKVPPRVEQTTSEGLLMAARDMDSEEPNGSRTASSPPDAADEKDP